MIKRAFIAIVALLLLAPTLLVAQTTPNADANDNRWSFHVSPGLSTLQHFAGGITTPDVVPGGTVHQDKYKLSLSFCADIYYRCNRWLSLGLRTATTYGSLKCYDNDWKQLGAIKALPFTAAVAFKTAYITRSEFQFYGIYGLAFGGTATLKNFHWIEAPSVELTGCIPEIYPFAFSVGEKEGFFAEFGVGSKGVVNMGYFVRF